LDKKKDNLTAMRKAECLEGQSGSLAAEERADVAVDEREDMKVVHRVDETAA
jgi:hypothetical protein